MTEAQAEQLRFCTVFRKDERLGQIMISTLFLPQVFRGGGVKCTHTYYTDYKYIYFSLLEPSKQCNIVREAPL